MSSGASVGIVREKPRGLGAGWEMLLVFLAGLATAYINDILCLAVFSGLVCWLVVRHYSSPADVLGIVFAAGCAAPLLRRVHDLFHGFRPGSLLLVVQYIAYPLLGASVVPELVKFRKSRFLPLIVSIVGIFWAYCVGALEVGVFPASMQLLEYISGPILFAYLVVLIDRFDVGKFSRWLLVLGALEGGYGVYQWVLVPPWDGYWFNQSGMALAGGFALPFQLRTFGTLNSTSPYAYFLFFTLVVTVRTRGYIFAAPLMIAGLATTLGRSTWGATVLGWAVLVVVARGRDKAKVVLPLATMFLVVVLVALPFSAKLEDLTRRLQTVTDIKNDNSFKDRSGLLDAAIRGGAFDDPIGVGFGMVGAASKASGKGVGGIDNGFLATAWMFGWIGSFFFLGGILLGMFRGLQGAYRMPLERLQYLGALVGLFVANLFEPAFSGFKGPMVWLSMGITNMWFAQRFDTIAPRGSAMVEPTDALGRMDTIQPDGPTEEPKDPDPEDQQKWAPPSDYVPPSWYVREEPADPISSTEFATSRSGDGSTGPDREVASPNPPENEVPAAEEGRQTIAILRWDGSWKSRSVEASRTAPEVSAEEFESLPDWGDDSRSDGSHSTAASRELPTAFGFPLEADAEDIESLPDLDDSRPDQPSI